MTRRVCGTLVALAAAVGGLGLGLTTGSSRATAAAGPAFSPSGWYLVFNFVAVGAHSAPEAVTVHNTGDGTLAFHKVALAGPNAGDFRIVSDTCSGASLAPGGSCSTSVRFQPTAAGTRVAALMYADNTPCLNWIQLAGSGTSSSAPARAATCTSSSTSTVTVPGPTQTKTVTQHTSTSHRVIVLPKACHSRRHFLIHISPALTARLKSVSVRLNGRSFHVLRGRRLTSVIDLRGLPRGRFTLVIHATTRSGHVLTLRRHYVTCVASR